MATIILALADLGAAMPLQEALEQSGHAVTWDGASTGGPANALAKADLVLLDAEDASSVEAAAAWRDHDPPPGVLMVGSTASGQERAKDARCHFVANSASSSLLEEKVAAVLKMRFAGRMSGPYARAVLGLGESIDPTTDAARIVKGSRGVDIGLAQECLRWHASDYVTATDVVAQLREERALFVPEIEVCKKLDGTQTVQRLVSGENGAMTGRLLWGLISAGAARTSPVPPDDRTPERRHVRMLRRHLKARAARLRNASFYEVLEVSKDANPQRVDYAARALAMRYAPDKLARLDLGNVAHLVTPTWQLILKARETLMDIASRGRYNDALEAKRGELQCPWAFDVEDESVSEEFFRRGQEALLAGEAFKAVSGIAGACRNHPDHPIYEAYLCWARFRSGVDKGEDRAALAKKERDTADAFLLGRRPWPNALVALALLCSADGDPDSARYHLKEALTIDPNLPVAKQLLGRLG